MVTCVGFLAGKWGGSGFPDALLPLKSDFRLNPNDLTPNMTAVAPEHKICWASHYFFFFCRGILDCLEAALLPWAAEDPPAVWFAALCLGDEVQSATSKVISNKSEKLHYTKDVCRKSLERSAYICIFS